jgi:hypothetical protein
LAVSALLASCLDPSLGVLGKAEDSAASVWQGHFAISHTGLVVGLAHGSICSGLIGTTEVVPFPVFSAGHRGAEALVPPNGSRGAEATLFQGRACGGGIPLLAKDARNVAPDGAY